MSTPTSTPTAHASHPAQTLLAKAHSTPTAAQIFTDKILHKPLLLSPSTEHSSRTQRRHVRLRKKQYYLAHARPRPLSAKEKRRLGIYDLRPEECRYELYERLNGLWNAYILELLGFVREGKLVPGAEGRVVNGASVGALLASADYHGMEVEVVRCRDVGRVGERGIVVRETRSTFVVVENQRETRARKRRKIESGEAQHEEEKGKKHDEEMGESRLDVSESTSLDVDERGKETEEKMDKVRTILKKGTVFRVFVRLPVVDSGQEEQKDDDSMEQEGIHENKTEQVRRLVFELHGDQLEIRPVERAVKKFKWKAMDNL